MNQPHQKTWLILCLKIFRYCYVLAHSILSYNLYYVKLLLEKPLPAQTPHPSPQLGIGNKKVPVTLTGTFLLRA
jgi:hypothetical protein